jgi:trehalose 6-phosphate phosphatase
MENLFSAWPDLQEQIQRARQILLLSDYDGTLTPIVDSPDAALIAKDTRQLLVELAALTRFKVGIISGRSLEDLKNKVNINGIVYAGNHGFEIDGPGLRFINPVANEIRPFLRLVRQILTSAVGTIKGVLVEDKGLTLSVHYRQADDAQAPLVQHIIKKTIYSTAVRGIVKMTEGKKVYEVRPAVSWDKGKAIRLLMKRYGKGGRQSGLLPIYLGDDLTDEDGFKIIERYGNGISVHVGGINPASAAHYYVDSPRDVYRFLDMLREFMPRNPLYDCSSKVKSEVDLSNPAELTG